VGAGLLSGGRDAARLSLGAERIADGDVTNCFPARPFAGTSWWKPRVSSCKSLYLAGFSPPPTLTAISGIRYARPVRISQNLQDATAGHPGRRFGRLAAILLAAALAGASGTTFAAPQGVRQPAMHPVDDRGLLDSVADKSTQLITNVRDGATGLVDSAMNFLGVRYKRGGNSADTGFDCSGFTRYVFENSIGRVLPHRADEQANSPDLVKVDQKDLKPGDLVFFNTMRRTFSHVGIYLGDGKFIHSPRTGESVRIEDIGIAYWARHFTGARRAPELAGASAIGADALAKLAAQAAGPAAASVAPTPALAASLNPSGLKLGSTLPSLPERSVVGFAPMHEPLARPLPDR
jgi:cell wall-associated NlpC family hydrolase